MADWRATQYLKLTTFKYASGNPQYVWRNTYEINRLSPAETLGDPTSFLTGWLTKEADLHSTYVRLFRATLATYVEDGLPDQAYNPGSFVTIDVAPIPGTRALGTEPMPRHVTLSVKRQVETGRSGKLHYRGVLDEQDVAGGSTLDPALTTAATNELQTLLTDFFVDTSSALDLYMSGGAVHALVSTSEVTGFAHRTVQGLVVRGVSVRKPDHKYFDRA